MKFVKNVSLTFATQVVTFFIGVISSVIVARTLGPERQGIYSLIILLPLLITTFTNMGIARSIVFYIGKDIFRYKRLIGNIMALIILISSISVIIGLIVILFLNNLVLPNVPASYALLILITIPLQLCLFQGFNGILLGLQKIKTYNSILIIHAVGLFVLIVLFLTKLNLGVIGVITANILALGLTIAITSLWLVVFSKDIPLTLNIDIKILKTLISFGSKVYLNNIFANLHLKADVYLLNFFLNPLAVGYYVISVRITERLWMLSQSVSTVLYPKVASMKNEERKKFTPIASRNVLFITVVGACLLFLLSNWLIHLLYGEKYLLSVEPLKILLIGIVAISIERVLANDLLARGKPMINTYITFLALFSNIILNVILIPKYGIIGAAWASSISYSLATIIKILAYCRLSGNSVSDVLLPQRSDINYYLDISRRIKQKTGLFTTRSNF